METISLVGPRVYVPDTNTDYPLYFSAEQAARVIGISRPTVMARIKDGLLKAEKSSAGVWNVDSRSVFAFLGLDCEVRSINV